jgi:hypothetical protein
MDVPDPTEIDGQRSGTGRDLAPGTSFGGYVIEDIAGRGGMGVVYRARQLRPSRVVALKVISPHLADDSDFRERFVRESEVAASIEHSNVIPVYDVGEESNLVYIAMRYVVGTDLRAVIAAEGRLAPRRAVQILAELTAALDAAHEHGLVHRDVKPANVLIALEGGRDHVYLTDFGLAKLAASGGKTRAGVFIGTLDYAAPEQVEGQRVDARTDIYAAGCVLFHMLTGSVPFPGEHEAAVMWSHMSAPPRSAREIVPSLPVELDRVVARAMAKNPDDRYQSAGDLGRHAVAAADGRHASLPEHSVATGRAAPAPVARTPPARTPPARTVLLAGGALVLIVAAVLAASGVLGSSSHHRKVIAQRRATTPLAPAPTTKTYANSRLGVSFTYPASWQPLVLQGSPADFGIGTGATETRCALEIEHGTGPATSSQKARFAFVRARAAYAARVAKHYELRAIEAEQGANITGVGLIRVANAQGGHLGFFFRGREVYVFDCVTPASSLDQVDRQAFAPLLASVRIGS